MLVSVRVCVRCLVFVCMRVTGTTSVGFLEVFMFVNVNVVVGYFIHDSESVCLSAFV